MLKGMKFACDLRLGLGLCLSVLSFVGCGEGLQHLTEASEAKLMFEQAQRVDASEQEMNRFALMLLLDEQGGVIGRCAASWIASERYSDLFQSANHCTRYQPYAACSRIQIHLPEAANQGKLTNSTRIGRCKEIKFASDNSDYLFFRITVDRPQLLNGMQQLYWSSTTPAVNTPLVSYGFPSDSERSRRATRTANCEVLKTDSVETWSDYLEERFNGNIPSDWQEASQRTDPRFEHNCSTYSGNSGGPLVIANSRIIVGMPSDYLREDAWQRSVERVEGRSNTGAFSRNGPKSARAEDAASFLKPLSRSSLAGQPQSANLIRDLGMRTVDARSYWNATRQRALDAVCFRPSEQRLSFVAFMNQLAGISMDHLWSQGFPLQQLDPACDYWLSRRQGARLASNASSTQ